MAKIERWTRNGDELPPVTETDPRRIRDLEESPFDESSNIERTRTTEER